MKFTFIDVNKNNVRLFDKDEKRSISIEWKDFFDKVSKNEIEINEIIDENLSSNLYGRPNGNSQKEKRRKIKNFFNALSPEKIKSLEKKSFYMNLGNYILKFKENFEVESDFSINGLIYNANGNERLKNFLPERLIEKVATIKVKENSKTKNIELNFSDSIQLYYLIREYYDETKIDISQVVNNDKLTYLIENKSKLYFLMKNLKNINFDISELPEKEQKFFKELDDLNGSIPKVNIDENPYVNNIYGYLEKNNGKGVIADRTDLKEESVVKWSNHKGLKPIVIGKPESLSKYESLEIKNRNSYKNTLLSSKKDIKRFSVYRGAKYTYENDIITMIGEPTNKVQIVPKEEWGKVTDIEIAKNGQIEVKYENNKSPIIFGTLKSLVTPNVEEIIKENQNADTIIFSDAEKIKDSKSIINYTFNRILEEIPTIKNKVFVTSNPIYNSLKEIEPILNHLDNDLLKEVQFLLKDMNKQSLKNKKNQFLVDIVKKYILKRDSSDLEEFIDKKNIKKVNYINKRLGTLKEEDEFYEQIKSSLDVFIEDIITISLKRIERNDYDENKKKNTNYKSLDYYMRDFEKFEAIQGKKLNVDQLINVTRLFREENLLPKDGSYSYGKVLEEEWIHENLDKLSNSNKSIAKSIISNNNLIEDFYEQILHTPFKKLKEYDIENDELIDGENFSLKQMEEIEGIVERTNDGLGEKEKKEIFTNNYTFKHKSKIDRYLKKVKSEISDIKSMYEFMNRSYEDIVKLNETNSSNKPYLQSRIIYLKSTLGVEMPPVDDEKKFKVFFNDKIKSLKSVQQDIRIILEGEKISFFSLLKRQLNLKTIHKKMALLKMKNTKRLISALTKEGKNVTVLSMYNDVIKELSSKNSDNSQVIGKGDEFNDIDEDTNVVFSTFNKVGENTKSNYDSALIYNDLPWNKATSEKIENIVPNKNVDVFLNIMEGNILDELFENRINSKAEQIQKIMHGEKITEATDDTFKEAMIKTVFKDSIKKIDKKKFEEIKKTVEHQMGFEQTLNNLNDGMDLF